MGIVWAAYNEATSREVALKLLVRPDPELRVRLLQEARACGAVRHRNIVDIYDVDETESGDPFLIMPLLTGETLASFLKRKRRLESAEAARIARDIARGLAAAHERGIIHRDLKPSNVFLHAEPGEREIVVKLLDFGVSKLLAGPQQIRTATGIMVGSPAYMSPEQVQSNGRIDPRADLWSLGVVMFEMLTGRRPIQGNPIEVLTKVLHGDIPKLAQLVRQIEPDLDALVSQCLQRDPALRPRSAADVAAALESFISLPAPPRGGGSSPDLRYDAPPPQGQQAPAIGAVLGPANATPLPGARPAIPSGWGHAPAGGPRGAAAGVSVALAGGTAPMPGIAAQGTPLPRERAPSHPTHALVGEHGTIKLSPEQTPGYRPQHHSAPALTAQRQHYAPPAPPLAPAEAAPRAAAPAGAIVAAPVSAPAGAIVAAPVPAPAGAIVAAPVSARAPSGSNAAVTGASPASASRSSRVAWIALALLAAVLLLGLGMAMGFLVMRAAVESLESTGGEQSALA